MFEFYFQRGDFAGDSSGVVDFIKDLVVQIVGTGIGAWAAFSVYRAQRRDAIEKEEKAKKEFEVDKLRYLDQLFSGAIAFARSLHACLLSAGAQLREDIYRYPTVILGTPTDLKRIVDKIDREAFYHSYRNQVKDHQIQGLFNNADLLNEQFDVFMYAYKSEQPESIRLRMEIRRLMVEINMKVSSFCSVSDEYDKYRKMIDLGLRKILDDVRQGKLNFDVMKDEFLLPMLEEAPQELAKVDPELRTLIDDADECFRNIVQLKKAHHTIVQQIFELTQSAATIQTELSERIQPLRDFIQRDSVSQSKPIRNFSSKFLQFFK
jgi:hypothetical protein